MKKIFIILFFIVTLGSITFSNKEFRFWVQNHVLNDYDEFLDCRSNQKFYMSFMQQITEYIEKNKEQPSSYLVIKNISNFSGLTYFLLSNFRSHSMVAVFHHRAGLRMFEIPLEEGIRAFENIVGVNFSDSNSSYNFGYLHGGCEFTRIYSNDEAHEYVLFNSGVVDSKIAGSINERAYEYASKFLQVSVESDKFFIDDLSLEEQISVVKNDELNQTFDRDMFFELESWHQSSRR